jgi:hypothetical protein
MDTMEHAKGSHHNANDQDNNYKQCNGCPSNLRRLWEAMILGGMAVLRRIRRVG